VIAGDLGGAAPAPSGGAPSVAGFPQAPLGSPGEIYGIARSLQQAATDLDESEHALRGAAATLMTDWQGDAAGAYQSASGGLSGVAGAAAKTFRECAGALSGYAERLSARRPRWVAYAASMIRPPSVRRWLPQPWAG
jgi:uncharacterized protein YukE